jgi:hypothetical protein
MIAGPLPLTSTLNGTTAAAVASLLTLAELAGLACGVFVGIAKVEVAAKDKLMLNAKLRNAIAWRRAETRALFFMMTSLLLSVSLCSDWDEL